MSGNEVYSPSTEFSSQAHVGSMEAYQELYRRAEADPEGFWAQQAESEVHWFEKWSHVYEWHPPFVKWFVGAKTNAAYNCLDRHLETRGDKPAIIFEGEPGDQKTLTYRELHAAVGQFSNVLKSRGFQAGDRAIVYMPMIPEAIVAMLACARLGIIHSVVFGGFSAEALKARILDLDASLVLTADGGWRRGKEVKLKGAVDEAVKDCPGIKDVLVYRRTGGECPMNEGRDHWWHDLLPGVSPDCPAEELDSEHPLFVLYTSGTTGKPKGILHTTGGYLTYVASTMKWVFDLKENDIYWCTADIGWVTGHSYIVYGPLACGATCLVYEGAPDFPAWDRWWDIVERHKATILYTSPTAIRALIKQGDEYPNKHDLSSLRLLGSVGEPINPAAWDWYYRVIGKSRSPIVDTWWQTETGGILIAPMPGAVPLKPGSGTLPMPGVLTDVVDFYGEKVAPGAEGFLIIRRPWPSMIRTIWGDPERFEQQYFSRMPGIYFTGDAARRDEDGYFWVLGRVDDVMNVSGHRLSTMEVESALVRHPAVAEAAVVGKPHEITGQAVCCFVSLKQGNWDHGVLGKELRQWVAHEIGAFARPEEIRFAESLPKTRSGKIMRRLLREIVTSNTVTGDVTTLEDLGVVTRLSAQHDED
ncbi:acetate--CoA ligase [Paludibaculum fermentans]|uniref:Acetyl-coenzyme A synthetase n=1 Tax=Paludibaculum fermentans TaxID=1473598 RepID=A0A7S7NSV7_PALFE|nr:acetate--CoA ligase [Paludibaculum fermentans]QOY89081.1 acetate--CoA ligase [Paludibaculum fermentans]